MDNQSRAKLEEILQKEPAALSADDGAFLRARRDYLSDEHKITYSEILGGDSVVVTEAKEEEEKPKRTKKSAN